MELIAGLPAEPNQQGQRFPAERADNQVQQQLGQRGDRAQTC